MRLPDPRTIAEWTVSLIAVAALVLSILVILAPPAAVLIGRGIEHALDLDTGPIPPRARP